MKSLLVLFSLPLLIAGCATSRETVVGEAQKGYFINCTGSFLSWRQCHEKAADLCSGKAYDVLVQSKEQGATLFMTPPGLLGEPVLNRTMSVRCKR